MFARWPKHLLGTRYLLIVILIFTCHAARILVVCQVCITIQSVKEESQFFKLTIIFAVYGGRSAQCTVM